MDITLDPRLHAFDPQTRMADTALRERLEGTDWQFVEPRRGWAGPSRVSLRTAPDAWAAQVTEALPGEALEVLWEQGVPVPDGGAEGWARARTRHDGYLGWARLGELIGQAVPSDLTVTALRAHAFAEPKVSAPIVAQLCHGARLGGQGEQVMTEDGYAWHPVTLPGGEAAWVQAVTLAPLPDADAAAFALRLLDTPYVWGGRSAWGLDCSGLTQLAYGAFGRALPRDADQQQGALLPVQSPQRGDLTFFPGHVGLMLDERRMVHANATHMRVTVETLGEGDYGRRLQASCTGFGRWRA